MQEERELIGYIPLPEYSACKHGAHDLDTHNCQALGTDTIVPARTLARGKRELTESHVLNISHLLNL